MSAREFTHAHSGKVASDNAAAYMRTLAAAGYSTPLFGRPQPGEFIVEAIANGFRVVVNPLPGRVAVLA